MENDKYYVERCLDGHPDDFRHLVRRYQPVLLRWKTADNEDRVVFGDLHTLTVDADTLAKLEVALPK